MPKASIIIPVYNAEKTIKYCLESILNQTFQDFEIIVINDGSKDNSQRIIESYKKKYPQKFRVYKQENKGVAITRNKGIGYARGFYLFFIDNDDYIDKDYLEIFIREIQNSKSDMVIGGYKRVDIHKNRVLYSKDTSDNPWVKYMFPICWAKVYKTSSLKNFKLEFLDINIGEDLYFSVIGNLCLNIAITPYNGYNWVYNKNSVLNTRINLNNKKVSLISLFDQIYEKIKSVKVSKTEEALIEYFFIKTAIYFLLHSGRGTNYEILKNEDRKLFEWIEGKYPQYSKNPNINPFKPEGEDLFVRVAIYTYVTLKRMSLENPFLKVYSKLPLNRQGG